MDHYSAADSSPRSHNADADNPQPATNYKVKLLCSYGGRIHPHHNNQLSYIGGETKILALDRSVNFPTVVAKLSALCGGTHVCFKYQLPGEDLDALISVTDDDDLQHMMHEYDRLNQDSSPSPAKLRVFLLTAGGSLTPRLTPVSSFGSTEGRIRRSERERERERFTDGLNSGHVPSVNFNLSPASPSDGKMLDLEKVMPPEASRMTSRTQNPNSQIVSDNETAIIDEQRAMEADRIQKLRIETEQQAYDNHNLAAGYYITKTTGNVISPSAYQISGVTTVSTDQQPVYVIQTPAGMYNGQGYYMQTMPAGIHHEQPVYNLTPPPPAAAAAMATQETTVSLQQQFVAQNVMTYPEGYQFAGGVRGLGYGEMAYDDGTGRPIYYATTTAAHDAVAAQPQQPPQATAQPMVAAAAVALNQETFVAANIREFM